VHVKWTVKGSSEIVVCKRFAMLMNKLFQDALSYKSNRSWKCAAFIHRKTIRPSFVAIL